jgi:DDE superfamily endonuclease/Helix-turn-helix of DDE superfamily endonuclease
MEAQKYLKLSAVSNTKFRRYTGVVRDVFNISVLIVQEYLRLTKLKDGRNCNLSIEDQILMMLEYYRENRTYFHLGMSYGLSESNVYRTIIKIENILIKSGYFRLSGKKALLSDKKIETIIIDVTETPAMRPKRKRRNKKSIKRSSKQKRKYSGKKKRHTHKIQLVIDADTKQIICIHFEKGSCHDFKLYKKSKLNIHPNIKQKLDSGYQGAQKIHENSELPVKASKYHKLTKEEKKQNRLLSQKRVFIEHTNAKCKVFKLLENRYRSHSRLGLRATLIACFINANAA